jgi:hypothetical protein
MTGLGRILSAFLICDLAFLYFDKVAGPCGSVPLYQAPPTHKIRVGAAFRGRPLVLTGLAVYVQLNAREDLAFNRCHLRLDHVVGVQLSTASKSQVLRRVRKCFRMRGVFDRRH